MADVDREKAHEEKSGDQHHHDYRHRRAELRVLVLRVWAGLGRGPFDHHLRTYKKKSDQSPDRTVGIGAEEHCFLFLSLVNVMCERVRICERERKVYI